MFSAVTVKKRTPFTGQLTGTHQRLDQVARRSLSPLLRRGVYFPSSKEILHFEGYRGPDGLKLKSDGSDEPDHFILPGEENPKLVNELKNHWYNLSEALREKNNVRSAFEAAWLAHLIADGLTPAHHVPYQETVEEMMGEKEFLRIFGKPITGIMRGNTTLEAAKNNWKYWGVNGLMSRHVAFEYGVALIVTSLPPRRYAPLLSKADLENFELEREFKAFLEEINKLDMYGRFARSGWTPKLTHDVQTLLLPSIIRLIALAWASALKEAEK